ncbi:unnamed protein product, partial [Porites evermanni]
CVLWGLRVVIPEKYRVRLLDDLEEEYHGIWRMKRTDLEDELFLGRQIRNCFTLLKPNLNKAVEEQQLRQKEHHGEGRVKLQEFKLNEVVLVRNWRRSVERWIPGRITQKKGPRTYLVCCEDQIRFVHVDHLK